MTAANRTTLLTKTHRTLKKHYKPVPPDLNRTLLEQLLFACCLENSPPEAAEKAYELLHERFFDLNEIRVTTQRELGEALSGLYDPDEAASRIKGILQSVFESQYSFDLESLKKQNIGQATKTLEAYDGITPFTLAYATQTALGGHAIPVNSGALRAFLVLDIVSESDAAKHKVPGLERAIPKNKGLEFGSLLHQFGVALYKNPVAPQVRKILLEIDPGCKDRLPKRQTKKEAAAEAAEAAGAASPKQSASQKKPPKKSSKSKRVAGKASKTTKKAAEGKQKKKKTKAETKAPAKAAAKKKTASKRLARRKPR